MTSKPRLEDIFKSDDTPDPTPPEPKFWLLGICLIGTLVFLLLSMLLIPPVS